MIKSAISISDQYRREVMRDAPVIYSPGFDTQAQAVDQSGNGNHGTYTGTVVKGLAGPFRGARAVKYDGSTGYITVPSSPSLQLGNSFTLEAWVYFNSVAGTQDFINKDNGLNNGYAFGLTAGKLFCYVAALAQGNTAPIVHNWYHFLVTKVGTIATFYVNGLKDGTASGNLSATTPTGSTALGIGVNVTSQTEFANALISHAAAYNSALPYDRIFARWKAATSSGRGISRRLLGNAIDGPLLSQAIGTLW